MEFAKNTRFLDVEGIPVTVGAGPAATPNIYCAAWDEKPPRRFPYESAVRNGAVVSQKEFEDLVAAALKASP